MDLQLASETLEGDDRRGLEVRHLDQKLRGWRERAGSRLYQARGSTPPSKVATVCVRAGHRSGVLQVVYVTRRADGRGSAAVRILGIRWTKRGARGGVEVREPK